MTLKHLFPTEDSVEKDRHGSQTFLLVGFHRFCGILFGRLMVLCIQKILKLPEDLKNFRFREVWPDLMTRQNAAKGFFIKTVEIFPLFFDIGYQIIWWIEYGLTEEIGFFWMAEEEGGTGSKIFLYRQFLLFGEMHS